MTKCPMCVEGKMQDFHCMLCGWVDIKAKKMSEAVKR